MLLEILKTLLPIFGVFAGWLLSERGKLYSDKRQDKRKLKKLLFFLLELRYRFATELSFELDLNRYVDLIKNKTMQRFGVDINSPEFQAGGEDWKSLLKTLTAKPEAPKENYEYISKNIDDILIDLAEFEPIMAYELNGRHNIKERLTKFEDYIKGIEALTNEMLFDVKNMINPSVTRELLKDLDESIYNIAKKIDNNTLTQSKVKIEKIDTNDDDKETNLAIDSFFDEVTIKMNL